MPLIFLSFFYQIKGEKHIKPASYHIYMCMYILRFKINTLKIKSAPGNLIVNIRNQILSYSWQFCENVKLFLTYILTDHLCFVYQHDCFYSNFVRITRALYCINKINQWYYQVAHVFDMGTRKIDSMK